MKRQYEAARELKTSVSGFTYSNKEGAGITLVQQDIWRKYIKVSWCHMKGSQGLHH